MEMPRSVESIVKFPALVLVPPGAPTVMGPVVAVPGTTALKVVLFITVKLLAGIPLNSTSVALVKLVPVIITLVPGRP